MIQSFFFSKNESIHLVIQVVMKNVIRFDSWFKQKSFDLIRFMIQIRIVYRSGCDRTKSEVVPHWLQEHLKRRHARWDQASPELVRAPLHTSLWPPGTTNTVLVWCIADLWQYTKTPLSCLLMEWQDIVFLTTEYKDLTIISNRLCSSFYKHLPSYASKRSCLGHPETFHICALRLWKLN